MLTFGGFLFILAMALVGAWRGALHFFASFGALLVAGVLGPPLHFLTGWMLAGVVPGVFRPLAGGALTGLLLFLSVLIPLELLVRRRERRRREAGLPPRESWQQVTGFVLGGAWGFCLVVLVCLGVAAIARVDRAMRTARAELDYRAERRLVEERRARKLARLTYSRAPETNPAVELAPVEVRELKLPPPADPRVEWLNTELERSVFAPVVDRVSPVDQRREEMLRELAVVVGDPYLFDRLQKHPKVSELARDERFQPLARDQEVAAAVKAGRFTDLLDHPRVTALARDEELRARLQALDVERLLREVRTR